MFILTKKVLDQIIFRGSVILNFSLYLPLYILFFPILIIIRLISPIFIIRFGELISSRIGHLAANTELYLCEKDSKINIPNKPYINIFYLKDKPYCNKFLIKKWKEILHIFPKWIIHPIYSLNNIIPLGNNHKIGNNTHGDRDVLNLLDKFEPHIMLTRNEENMGQTILNEMGISLNSRIVCLLVRDSSYLKTKMPNGNWDYHNYRDSDIENYLPAAEYLAEKGFFIVRMGKEVNKPLVSNKTNIIDYASSKYVSDFMDIYLGAKCTFCISTGAGWDAVPAWLFRKPTIFTNLVPFGYLPTFSDKFLLTTKRHYSQILNRDLTVSEIYNFGVYNFLHTSSYNDKQLILIENTPEELKYVVIEMIEYINLEMDENRSEELISKRFWKLYSELNNTFSTNNFLHGELKSRFSNSYLKNNHQWIN